MRDRAGALRHAPLPELLAILLRQYKRLLAEHGVTLSEADIQALAQQMSAQAVTDERTAAVRDILVRLVMESEQVLGRWNLTFEQSLRTDMSAIAGWETTSEFLETANEKGNAELRIASASALLVALGDLRYAEHLLAAIAHDPDEIETVAARRLLSSASGVASDAADWPAQVAAWLRR